MSEIEKFEPNGGGEDEKQERELTPEEQKQQKIERVKSTIEQIEHHIKMISHFLETTKTFYEKRLAELNEELALKNKYPNSAGQDLGQFFGMTLTIGRLQKETEELKSSIDNETARLQKLESELSAKKQELAELEKD